MSMMQVSCPACHTPLRVPENAAGRRARCPVCRTKFVVPRLSDLLDETVCAWLLSDMTSQEPAEEEDSLPSSPPPSRPAAAPVSTPPTPPPSSPQDTALISPSESPRSSQSTPTSATVSATASSPGLNIPHWQQGPAAVIPEPPLPPPAPPASPPPVPPAQLSLTSTVSSSPPPGPSIASPSSGPLPAAPAVAGPPAPSAPSARTDSAPTMLLGARTSQAPTAFPTELIPTGPRPHLVIQEVSQAGVRVAFDSSWLDHLGFRCSVPVRGIFNGTTQRDQLVARPFIWLDRAPNLFPSAAEAEMRYQQHLLENWTIRDVIEAIGLIEGMPRPFCYPMPYYIDQEHLNLSIQCSTYLRPDGGITCMVLVPNPQVALEWVRNVNGVWAPEYELLEHELAIMRSDNWAALPEQIRQRLSVWCRFRPREHFLLYIRDADLTVRDAGLGGLVLTDQRLIYHKFHHLSQIDLQESGALCIRRQSDGIYLGYEHWSTPGHRTRLGKILESDLPPLLEAVRSLTSWHIQGPD